MIFILEDIQRETVMGIQGELKKIKLPNFDGDKSNKIVDIWLLEMKKYL